MSPLARAGQYGGCGGVRARRGRDCCCDRCCGQRRTSALAMWHVGACDGGECAERCEEGCSLEAGRAPPLS